jgi:hypothetical protein
MERKNQLVSEVADTEEKEINGQENCAVIVETIHKAVMLQHVKEQLNVGVNSLI